MNDTETTGLAFSLSVELIETARAKEYGQFRERHDREHHHEAGLRGHHDRRQAR